MESFSFVVPQGIFFYIFYFILDDAWIFLT